MCIIISINISTNERGKIMKFKKNNLLHFLLIDACSATENTTDVTQDQTESIKTHSLKNTKTKSY